MTSEDTTTHLQDITNLVSLLSFDNCSEFEGVIDSDLILILISHVLN